MMNPYVQSSQYSKHYGSTFELSSQLTSNPPHHQQRVSTIDKTPSDLLSKAIAMGYVQQPKRSNSSNMETISRISTTRQSAHIKMRTITSSCPTKPSTSYKRSAEEKTGATVEPNHIRGNRFLPIFILSENITIQAEKNSRYFSRLFK
jgi:hypothetical protein